MSVWRSLHEVPAELGRTVVTIGNFDGVHLGHRALIRRGRRLADSLQADALVAVTFDPHPLALLRPASAPALLTTLDERLQLLTERERRRRRHHTAYSLICEEPIYKDSSAGSPM